MSKNNNKDFNNNQSNQYHRSGIKDFCEVLTVILISIFSGFVLGLLFAPQSGLKTRKKVIEKLKDIIDRGKFTITEAKVVGEELLEKGKEKVGKVSSFIKGENQADTN